MDIFDGLNSWDGLDSLLSPFQLETMTYWDNTTMLTNLSKGENDIFNDVFNDDILVENKEIKSKFQPAPTVPLDKITFRNDPPVESSIIEIINPPDQSPDHLENLPTPQIIPQNQSIILPNFFPSEVSILHPLTLQNANQINLDHNRDMLYPYHSIFSEFTSVPKTIYQKRCRSQLVETPDPKPIKHFKPSTPRHKIKSKKLTKAFSATTYMSSKNRRQRQTQKARYQIGRAHV